MIHKIIWDYNDEFLNCEDIARSQAPGVGPALVGRNLRRIHILGIFESQSGVNLGQDLYFRGELILTPPQQSIAMLGDHEEALEWVTSFHEAGDSLNTKGLIPFYSDDAILRWANFPSIEGRENILNFFDQIFVDYV